MKNFIFNQLYVIQSLPFEYNELGGVKTQTGEQLYLDLLRWQEYKHTSLKVFFKEIHSKQEWNDLMESILEDCNNNGSIPILHFEIHAQKTEGVFTPGFVLDNNELIDIETIGKHLRAINMATHCNLFITLAVCKGMSILLNMHESQPMPFIGAIGSFYEVEESDLYLRYMDFYAELFESFDIAKSYLALSKANPNMNSYYRYIPADELFIRNYQRYIDEQCTPIAIKKRASDSEYLLPDPPKNRAEKRRFWKLFSKQEWKYRAHYYNEAVNSFFMLKDYPDNKDRFEVPMTINEMIRRSQMLVLV